MLANKARIRLGLVLFVIALLVLSCSSPVPTTQTSQVTKVTQEKSNTRSVPTETATITLVPSETPTASPTAVPLLYAKVVSAGFSQTCAVTLSDGLKCWGKYLGNNPPNEPANTDHTYPLDVPGLESGVKDVDSNNNFTCVLMISGGVKCWGVNSYGQLGDDHASGDYSYTPVDVKGLSSGVAAISTGYMHACALLETGAVKCWGSSGGGLLGNYVYWAARTPLDVIGLSSGVIDIDAGFDHTCALMKTGGVKCWGAQGWGPVLGSGYGGYHNPEYSVVDVKGLSSGVVAIAVGDDFSCALMKGGGVKCWGYGSGGVLGDGTNTDRPTPVDVFGLDQPAIAIDAGDISVCALLENGSIKCWGDNWAFFQSKDSTFSVPTKIDGFTKTITSISVGLEHACAVMEDNTVMCLGRNAAGQLGVGSTQGPLAPSYVLCPDCGG
jgi:alpha-tubulin suppressor-like RCC1 family protein